MKMKEDLQVVIDEYCGGGVHKVGNFTKEQLKDSMRDYLLDKGLQDYVVDILVNELSIRQVINSIQKTIDLDSNILYSLLSNEVLEY